MAWWLTPRTPDPEVEGLSPTRVIITPKSNGNTQEAVASSQND